MPDHDFSVAYAATVGGGARLVDSYYKKESKSDAHGLSQDELERKIRHDFVEMMEEASLEDLEAIVRRKRAALRQGKPLNLPAAIDVEAP